MTLSIFEYTCWPFLCFILKNVDAGPLAHFEIEFSYVLIGGCHTHPCPWWQVLHLLTADLEADLWFGSSPARLWPQRQSHSPGDLAATTLTHTPSNWTINHTNQLLMILQDILISIDHLLLYKDFSIRIEKAPF